MGLKQGCALFTLVVSRYYKYEVVIILSFVATIMPALQVRSHSRSYSTGDADTANAEAFSLVSGLQGEMTRRGAKRGPLVDIYLAKIYQNAEKSEQNAQDLVNAGVIPLVAELLSRRAEGDRKGLEVVLITLGILACDSASAKLISDRKQTVQEFIQLCSPSHSEKVIILSLWCLNRICRSAEVAHELIKLKFIFAIEKLAIDGIIPTMAVYCLGTLIQTDALAELVDSFEVVPYLIRHLRRTVQDDLHPDDICAGLYAIARLSRSIKLAKELTGAGCIPLITFNLRYSKDPDVLDWSARAVGCLMRPNSVDMAKALLDAGAAPGLARLPTALAPDCLRPLASLGFAVQRFSCAEWGKGTRVALLEAGVIDSLLAALRTAAIEPCNEVQVELALAVSLLGDVGGSVIRKEIVNAGGVDILKSVASRGTLDVAKACNIAITSIVGNLLTRNAATARTAMQHNWNGGCPEHHPLCPLTLKVDSPKREGSASV
ncbi:hypothetical protein D9758_004461 [Tetrapyrgos nigripes]|uniref:Uncharacterized protein n=1 Tax=Tetrapyrgos nigripes TaxID=182062 RepID=A0A8H5GN53_9AGAR|nr:hypothetical protein D9758_004461 [Tetrapyrgos nigripes]